MVKGIVVGVLLLGIILAPSGEAGVQEVPLQIQIQTSFIWVGDNAIIAVASPLTILYEIIKRESHGDPTGKNPKSSAYGLCQFLDGTWEYVQKKWNMELDRHSPEDQLYACERLLVEEGIKHWIESGPYSYGQNL